MKNVNLPKNSTWVEKLRFRILRFQHGLQDYNVEDLFELRLRPTSKRRRQVGELKFSSGAGNEYEEQEHIKYHIFIKEDRTYQSAN